MLRGKPQSACKGTKKIWNDLILLKIFILQGHDKS